MIETLKKIILDFQENEFSSGVPRNLKIKSVRGKASVCIGVRRCGKTTLFYQIMNSLKNKGIPRENIVYINFFDDRLHLLNSKNMHLVTDAYFSLYPSKKGKDKIYCFFDEIQSVFGWEPFIERILREEKCEVYITGSSARMLSREIATQMRGRALSWELFPFSFGEYLDFNGINHRCPFSSKQELFIRKAFEEFREEGGFPETAGLDRQLRIKIHQQYFHAVLFRDLIDRHNISHPNALKDLAHKLIDNNSSMYSANRLHGFLRSLGHALPKATVSDYLDWFEDAYFFFTVAKYDASLARRRTNPKKIYCVDHSMVKSLSSGILQNSGHLLENLVFTSLRRVYGDVSYYKTEKGSEVDFVCIGGDKEKILVQVCETVSEENTRARETRALKEAMSELSVRSATVVTLHEEEEIEVSEGIISITPAWRFLLSLEM